MGTWIVNYLPAPVRKFAEGVEIPIFCEVCKVRADRQASDYFGYVWQRALGLAATRRAARSRARTLYYLALDGISK